MIGCDTAKKNALKEGFSNKITELEELQEQGYTKYYQQGEDIDSIENSLEQLRSMLAEMTAVVPTNAETLKKQLNGELRVKFNGISKPRDEVIKSVTVMTNMATKIKTDKGTYTFVQGQDRSVNFKGTNNHVVVDGLGYLTNQYKSLEDEMDEVTGYLHAKAGTKKSTNDKYLELEADIHGNPEKMVELLDKLNEMDATPETDEHMEYLRDLIKALNPEFIRKAKTFVMENAVENGGMVVGKDVRIMLGKSARIGRNQQSAAEVYAHEIIHAYTKFAVQLARKGDIEAQKILRELHYVMKVAKADMTWKDFLPDKKEFTTEEEQEAKDRYDYVFDVNSQKKQDWKAHGFAEDEFLAHALTNPAMIRKLRRVELREHVVAKSLWERVKGIFDTIVGMLMGDFRFKDRTKNTQELTLELVGMFAEHNNRAVTKLRERVGAVEQLTDMFDNVEQKFVDQVEKLVQKILPKNKLIGPSPENPLAKAAWMAKAVTMMSTSQEGRKQLFLILRSAGLPLYGTIASILRDFGDGDVLEKSIDWLALQADKIDQTKMSVISTTKDNVRSAFKNKLTALEEEQLTAVVLDTDLQSISGQYTNKEMRELLEDEAKLLTEIGRVKYELKKLDPDNYNWNTTQATGLGYYMATGKAHIAQNTNVENIAKGRLSPAYRRGWVNKKGDLEGLIDKVATLHALASTDANAKKAVAQLMKDEKKGIEAVLDTARYLQKEAKETIFHGQTAFMVKGHSKELFDSSIAMEVAPVEEHEEMLKRGFKRISDLEGHKGAETGKKYAMYVSTTFTTNEWHRAATRLTGMHTKGTSLKDLYYKEGDELSDKRHRLTRLKLDTQRIKIAKSMIAGTFDKDTVEMGLAPLTDQFGEVMDYRYLMDKQAKKELMNQDTGVLNVLGATRGVLLDKQLTGAHNVKILGVVKEDAKENYIPGQTVGKNGIPYILIKDGTDNKYVQDLWNVLPKEFKKEAYASKSKGIPIREDMVVNLFGYRHLSLADSAVLKRITPAFIQSIIRVAEALWIEFIKISKVDILIKMPFVLVGNILSNVVYAINTGSSPAEVLKMYLTSFRNTRSYLRDHRELVKLQELNNMKQAKPKDLERIIVLQRELKMNPTHELYEMGLYQAIVEDTDKEELSGTNRLKKAYNAKMAGVPKVIKDGLNWIYLTEETQYYKLMTGILQMSDLIARDVENQKFKKMQELQVKGQKQLPRWYINNLGDSKDEMAVSVRLLQDFTNRSRKMSAEEKKYFTTLADDYRKNTVLNAFINYNKPSGSLEEYLNRTGFMMFTKYAKRIQKVIVHAGKGYPLRSLLLALADGYLVDIEAIQEQSVFTRSWHNMTPQWPWERVMDVFTPPILQATTYRVL